MGLASNLGNEINDWVKLAFIVVVSSIVLLKFKTSGSICPTGYLFNASTSNTCYLATNSSVTTDATANLGTLIDTFVAAFSEPANWVAIVIIAIVGYGIMKYFTGKNSK